LIADLLELRMVWAPRSSPTNNHQIGTDEAVVLDRGAQFGSVTRAELWPHLRVVSGTGLPRIEALRGRLDHSPQWDASIVA
jgi:hypothetical protein